MSNENLAEFEKMGKNAFHNGLSSIPVKDIKLMNFIRNHRKDYYGSLEKVFDAWLKGWHSENLKAPVRNPEEEIQLDDIPEVKVINNTITLGTTTYNLIMYYECPVCAKPLIAYWQVEDNQERATANLVGRALKDSGFGGYRFFESTKGQGFEYDPERDPRKRHQHVKQERYSWGGVGDITEMFNNYLKFNPVYNINDMMKDILNMFGYWSFPSEHRYVDHPRYAMDIIKGLNNKHPEIFLTLKDRENHGKQMFFLDVVKLKKLFGSVYSEKAAVDGLINFFGRDLLSMMELKGSINTAIAKDMGTSNPVKMKEHIMGNGYFYFIPNNILNKALRSIDVKPNDQNRKNLAYLIQQEANQNLDLQLDREDYFYEVWKANFPLKKMEVYDPTKKTEIMLYTNMDESALKELLILIDIEPDSTNIEHLRKIIWDCGKDEIQDVIKSQDLKETWNYYKKTIFDQSAMFGG